MSDDGWDDYTYQTDVFRYSYKQFITLRTTTLAISCISLVSSFLIIIVYLYMLLRHRKKANRVSLRCVFLCSVMNTVNTVLTIVSTHRPGDTIFCRVTGVIIGSTNIMSTSLLTVVGLNLVLIFVFKVEQTHLLERFYYPAAVIYTMIGTIGPIYQEVTETPSDMDQYSCWYYMNIEDRTHSIFSWMWFYCFLFFANIIAILCSAAAMTKLLHEHRVFDRKMGSISRNASFTPNESNLKVKENQNKVFTKVVLRCIIYPLVPFLSNIFGFVLQMVITASSNSPEFYLTMLDIVFSYIQGFFVAIVFFTDPTVTSFLKESFHELCEKYIHQYTLVHINNYEIIQRRYLPQVDPPLDSILPKSLKYFPDTIDEKTTTNQKYKSEIPIRRIKLEYNNSSNKNNDVNGVLGLEIHLDSLKNDTGYLLPSSSHPESKFAYIPYRYPRLATCIHWLLRCVGIKPRHSPEMTNDDAAESSSSGRSSNVDMPLISKPKNVLLA